MGISFLPTPKHRVFHYEPRYWNEKEEKMRERYAKYGKEYDPKVATPIDYIYYSGFGKCLKFKVVNNPSADKKYISDHYPIYADIEF